MVGREGPTVLGSYGHAWQQLRRCFWQLILVWLVWLLVYAVGWLLQLVLNVQQGPAGIFTVFIANMAYTYLVMNPVTFGALYAYLRGARGEVPHVGDLLTPFRRAYRASVVAAFLMVLILAGGMAPGYVTINLLLGFVQPDVFGLALLLAVALLLLIAPLAYILARLAFVPFLVMDEGAGPLTAIKESWRRVSGYGWSVLGVGLLGIPTALLGSLALLVGIIPASNLIFLAFASLFDAVTAHRGGVAGRQ